LTLLVPGIMLAWSHNTFAGLQTHFQVGSNTVQMIGQWNMLVHFAAFVKIHFATWMLGAAYETGHQFFPPLHPKIYSWARSLAVANKK